MTSKPLPHPPSYAIVRADEEFHVVHSHKRPGRKHFSHPRKTEAQKYVAQCQARDQAKRDAAEAKQKAAEMKAKQKAKAK